MKKIFSILAIAFFACTTILAQGIKEPDFLGEVVILNPDSTTTKLFQEQASIKAGGGLGSMVPMIGSIKSYMIVKGKEAKTRLSANNNPIQLIVRCSNNEKDPSSIISLVKFEEKKKERRAFMGKTSLFHGSEINMPVSLPFEAEKFGEYSYKITVNLEPGEYGVLSAEQDASVMNYGFRCFGVE